MITSFKDKSTEAIWNGEFAKKIPPHIQEIARRKLRMINNSHGVLDLKIPPANHLEKLKGNRDGQFSIRINDQYRICFNFADGNATNVEITDYHI
ncbi:MAG: type II toxin-antitoxin system RelE/ParE family toxin [Spirochaetes bacterium]|nr:type II toxin-antitoxin system RelE/ParE family toxin [Spirochaetota bacterium]